MAVGLLLVLSCNAVAELRLPIVLGDHMVLQRDAPVPIWGSADPRQVVTVRFGEQIEEATADHAGHWRVDLDPMPASDAPRVLYVQAGGKMLKRQDILVGDVWLCAGQSNMQMGLLRAADGESEVAKARDPLLRLLRLENHVVPRGEDASGAWASCTPESAERFSAVGYYFGLAIRENQDVPVGLIVSAWGATGVESWLPIEVVRDEPAFASTRERDRIRERERPRMEAEHEAALAKWRTERDAAEATGKKPPNPPRQPNALRPQSQSGSLYDAMIVPLVPFAMRGTVWYQGESNVGRGDYYRKMLMGLVGSWRRAWEQDHYYFGIVQLPNYRPVATEPGDSDWAELREAQRRVALTLRDAGLAVTIDLGDPDNGHPKNKRDVGDRLARRVLADVYGQQFPGHGPVFVGASFDGEAAELTFADGPGELSSINGDQPGSFAIAGADQRWHWAEVEVIGSRKLRVWSPDVPEPLAVRYAWADNPPSANLTDGTGLPASPFRTDDWQK
jgi:sialate O-acetylesterase